MERGSPGAGRASKRDRGSEQGAGSDAALAGAGFEERVESMGWITESSVQPKKGRVIEGVGTGLAGGAAGAALPLAGGRQEGRHGGASSGQDTDQGSPWSFQQRRRGQSQTVRCAYALPLNVTIRVHDLHRRVTFRGTI